MSINYDLKLKVRFTEVLDSRVDFPRKEGGDLGREEINKSCPVNSEI